MPKSTLPLANPDRVPQAAAEPLMPGGLWIGWTLPDAMAQQLALPDGLAPADLAVTLAELDPTDAVPVDALARVQAVLRVFSWSIQPFPVRITSVARVHGDDGRDQIVASVSPVMLGWLRDRVWAALADVGVFPQLDDTDARPFVPQIVLAELDPTASWTCPSLPVDRWMVDTLTLDSGDGPQPFPMQAAASVDGADVLQAAEPKRANLADIAARGKADRLFMAAPQVFAQPPDWMPLLPAPGHYSHPVYGDIEISAERNARFVDHVNRAIYQDRLPVDAEHETKLSGAVGWIIGARLNADGSADGRVEWNERGRGLIAGDRYRYVSPEWFDRWQDPGTEEWFDDVLVGAAITNHPFFKDSYLRPLVASEDGLEIGEPAQPARTTLAADPPREDDVTQSIHSASDAEQQTITASEPINFAEQLAQKDAELAALRQASDLQQSALTQATEQITALMTADRKRRFTDVVMGRGGDTDGVRWFGEPDKHVAMLDKLAQAFGEDSDEFRSYVDLNTTTAAQLAASALFIEVGSGASGAAPSAADQLQAKADELRAANVSLSDAQAYSLAVEQNPSLYAEHKAGR